MSEPDGHRPEKESEPRANILLVDDNPTSLLVLRTTLRDLGQNLVEARSGEEALARLRQDDFALVLLDVQMPGLDGFETAKVIRAMRDKNPPHIPIIFVTGLENEQSLVEKAYSLGAVDFLVKPVVPVIVRAKVASFVELFQKSQQVQQQAEQLRSSEERFRLLVEGTQDYGIFMLDPKGQVISWNPGAERIKGYRGDEIIGQHFSRFYPAEDIESGKPERELEIATNQGKCEDEGWRVRKDGSQFWASVVIAALRDETGNLRGFSKITRDITGKKQAEEIARSLLKEEGARLAAEQHARIMQEQREKLHVTLQSIGDAVIVIDAEGQVGMINPVAQTLTGWTPEDAIGKSLPDVFNIVNEQTRQPVENPALRALDEGVIVGLANHTILIARNGTECPIDDSAAPIRDSQGRTVGVVLVFRDITERKRSEQTAHFLADASASLAVLVDYESTMQKVASLAVPHFADWVAVDVAEPDGSLHRVAVAHVNPSKIELAHELNRRYPPDQSAPQGVWNILRTGKSEMVPEITDDLLVKGTKDDEHLRIVRELGLRSYIGVPLDVRGKTMGVITFIAAESGCRYDSKDLAVAEDLARRAAIAIENTRLYRDLRQADHRKDEFLAMLAHELRNPLAPIRSGLDVLALDKNGDTDTIELMRQQVEHLVRLVDDLLDVSRIIQGKVELRREPVALSSIIRRSVDAVRVAVDDQEQHLSVSISDEAIWVDADPVRLVQVVQNLLSNASKYNDRGGRIRLNVERDDGGVCISVEDDGIGIDPDLLPHVFDLFTQSPRSLDRSQGGLGIGLTLVKNLIEMHGGSVSASSEGPGKGSRFQVFLPITERVQVAEPQASLPQLSRGRRILVVEDNVGAAKVLSILISRLGPHEIQMAHDGPSAIEQARTFCPEIILLDIGLPGLDGYSVARRLRVGDACGEPLLVALTGYGQEEDRRRSSAAGFDEHLVKPVDIETMRGLLSHPKLVSEQSR